MKPAIWKHATSIDIIPSAIMGAFGLVNLPILWLNSFIYSVTLFYGFTWLFNRGIESQPVWTDKGCGSGKQIKPAL